MPHAWAYLPDIARASVDLLELRHALPRFAPFHFAGHVLDTSALIAEVERALGGARRRTLRMPWWLVQLASPFSRLLRLALGVRYLWLEPVLLDGSKLARTLPEFRQTALPEAVLETLRAIAQRERAPDPMRRVLSAASTA